jgi:outer membrane lipoprotein-sorting protein
MRKLVTMILPVFAVGLLFGSVGVLEAPAQTKLREILNRMDAHNKVLTTLRAKVTMVKSEAALGVSDTQIGTAIYAKGKSRNPLVRIDWEKPQESLAVKDGQYVMYRPKLNIAYMGSTKSAGGNAKANNALAFMSMSKAELDANYTVSLLGDNETLSSGAQTWHLRLTPKNKASYKSAELWVNPDGMPLQTKILELNNDTTTVLLTNLEENIRLEGSDFQITLPKGTKIQKS